MLTFPGESETYDGDSLVAEYNGSNQLQRRYVHGPGMNEPVVWYEGNGSIKSLRIPRNPAATPRMENIEKIGISTERKGALLDRRICVAPMMDWSDEVGSSC